MFWQEQAAGGAEQSQGDSGRRAGLGTGSSSSDALRDAHTALPCPELCSQHQFLLGQWAATSLRARENRERTQRRRSCSPPDLVSQIMRLK